MIPHFLTPAILSALGFWLLLAPAALRAQGPASPRLAPPEAAHAVAASLYPALRGGCTDDIIGGGLLGAALGGVLGGLVGSRIHKHEPWSHR